MFCTDYAYFQLQQPMDTKLGILPNWTKKNAFYLSGDLCFSKKYLT